jgi:hypothetical protein
MICVEVYGDRPDEVCYGIWLPDDERQGICLPDTECQGIYLPDTECQGIHLCGTTVYIFQTMHVSSLAAPNSIRPHVYVLDEWALVRLGRSVNARVA